jgi:site-specific DNA-methyltransferase (adenine-specific)
MINTQPNRMPLEGYKPKDLIGIPWMVAFALRADGWYLRSDIIWHKPNCMPESVADRPTKAHEYIFLLSKSERYFYDADAIKEQTTGNSHSRGSGVHPKSVDPGKGIKANSSFEAACRDIVTSRNKRTVWTIPSHPFKEAHFATFPEALVEPCILAGCPESGIVLDPFFGAGTVGVVAKKRGRRYIGTELNPEYCEIARRRIAAVPARLDRWAEGSL